MDDDFSEQFLKANANPEFITHRFADVVRDLMRCVAADEPSRPLYSAAEGMKFVMELLKRCENPVTWYSIFTSAVASIHQMLPEDGDDRLYLRAARDGLKYLVESSATDNAARGRASRRLSEFISMIESSRRSTRGDG